MMEIRIETDLDAVLPERIEFNYDELRVKIDERLEAYGGKAETDDSNYQNRKEDRARLNKLSIMLNNERKEIKKRLLAPMENKGNDELSFSKQIDDLIGKIAMVVGEIDEGIKTYEGVKREAKRVEIQRYVDDISDSDCMKSHLTAFTDEQFARKNNAWQNITCGMDQIKSELDAEMKRCTEAVETIGIITENDSAFVKSIVMDSLVKGGYSIQEANSALVKYREIEKANRENEERKEKEKERQMSERLQVEPIGENGAHPSEIYCCTMKMCGTLKAFENLKQYIEMNGDITYEVVESMKEVE